MTAIHFYKESLVKNTSDSVHNLNINVVIVIIINYTQLFFLGMKI